MYKIVNKIKLVIWDLDETFWKGTLSEEGIKYIQENHNLVIELTNRGIVNSICSKNDFINVKNTLTQYEIWDYFVFPAIDWIPKGKMVEQIIERMNLRAQNVLFIDDNLMNLNEVSYMNKSINVCEPRYIKDLLQSPYLKGKDDSKHTRLIQYKNLEQKVIDFESSTGSNIDFLKDSNILVSVDKNCIDEIDRITELIERTNQLNYTKLRDSKDILIQKIKNLNNESGYISVKDKYGDYGIVGFYLLNKPTNTLEHFVFSCRTLNMYIETWLYKKIGTPILKIVGDVASELDLNLDIDFIKELCSVNFNSVNNEIITESQIDSNILLMGGCDLDQVVYYLNSKNIDTEFNYVNNLNLNVHKDHTLLIKQFTNFKDDYIEIIKKLPILSKNDIELKINNTNWDILIFSPLNDYSRGIYKHKETGFRLPFDAFQIDWTNSKYWNNLPKHLSTLPNSFFSLLQKEFDFEGPITSNEFSENLNWLINNFKNKQFIFLNGSTLKIKNTKWWEKDMDKRHIEMNNVLKDLSFKYNNVHLIDIPDLINNDPSLHTDNLRHYNKSVYKNIADHTINLLNNIGINNIKSVSNEIVFVKKLFNKIKSYTKKISR